MFPAGRRELHAGRVRYPALAARLYTLPHKPTSQRTRRVLFPPEEAPAGLLVAFVLLDFELAEEAL